MHESWEIYVCFFNVSRNTANNRVLSETLSLVVRNARIYSFKDIKKGKLGTLFVLSYFMEG